MNQRTVLQSHKASYSDPIRLAKGGILRLTGRQELWDGHRWLWAVAEDGKEGWVPDTLIAGAGNRTIASRDYSAIELTCAAGDILDVAWETHGWALCRKSDGTEGWVPLANLSER